MDQIIVTAEQASKLTEDVDYVLLAIHKNQTIQVARRIRKSLFENTIDFHPPDRGALTGHSRVIRDGRVQHVVAEVSFQNVRGFTGYA